MIETREAIQNLDSILDLEVGKVKIFYFNEIKSFAGGGRCFSWTRRPLHLFWGLHRPWPAKVSNMSSREYEDTNWGLWPVKVRTGKYVTTPLTLVFSFVLLKGFGGQSFYIFSNKPIRVKLGGVPLKVLDSATF